MTVEELMDDLKRKLRNGVITEDNEIVVRNPEISDDAMEAGSEGYHEVDEILVPRDGRIVLLGAS